MFKQRCNVVIKRALTRTPLITVSEGNKQIVIHWFFVGDVKMKNFL